MAGYQVRLVWAWLLLGEYKRQSNLLKFYLKLMLCKMSV